MRAIYSFIVEPLNKRRYDNIKTLGNVDLITSVSEEDHKSSNRYGVVKSLPIQYNGDIKVGDILLVHHNVFKFYNDMYGRRKSGKSYFKENLFLIDSDQFFMYKQNNKWYSHDKYCFVRPIKTKKSVLLKNTKYEPLVGELVYTNKELDALGVKEGDEVIFRPDSEYEFKVDDELLYRMFTDNITTVLNE